MKSINIISLIQAFETLNEQSYKSFVRHYGIEIKNKEIDDLKSLIDKINSKTKKITVFNQYYVSYKIPQIGKEFDLLRFGKDCVINIELKSSSTKEKVLRQLKRNRYYLCFLKKEIHNFTYVSDEKKLYYLNSDKITKVKFSRLVTLLEKQNIQMLNDVNKLFNPSDYLVSPFNSTDRFINNEYFLTHQQEETKTNIIAAINNNSAANFISITGSAGTGKTLLTYDIAKEVMSNDGKVLVIHCGQLNEGQEKLNIKYAWKVIAIKNYAQHTLSDYDLVITDETQRIYPSQLDKIIKKIQAINGNCIFSYDKLQTLALKEESRNIPKKIDDIISIVTYKLSEKIRTNKEIASFIRVLFNKNNNIEVLNKNNIELNYFNNIEDAKEFLNSLNQQGWEVIRFTPSQYSNEHHEKYSLYQNETSHRVIGQEFDKVAVTIDKFFSYHKNGALIYKAKAYYSPVKMLFQNITRTRKKLNVVIIGNSEILERCLSALKEK